MLRRMSTEGCTPARKRLATPTEAATVVSNNPRQKNQTEYVPQSSEGLKIRYPSQQECRHHRSRGVADSNAQRSGMRDRT